MRRPTEFGSIKSRVKDLLELQNQAESTIVEHDYTRADKSNISEGGGDNEDNDTDHNDYTMAHAKKQSALSNQLSNLNKMLAQKGEAGVRHVRQ